MNIVGVPVKVSDVSIILTSVEHDEVNEVSYREGAPDSQLVTVSLIPRCSTEYSPNRFIST